MSVLTHLTSKASNAVLSQTEKDAISLSIATLRTRINLYFNDEVNRHFQFGSSTRGTILPRSMDESSDIDYMIIFKDSFLTPQTYLTKLRSFVEKYYSSSQIYQSSPTIVLELGHIKFELVPALENFYEGIKIPNTSGGWQKTNPNDFNAGLERKNTDNYFLIKPTIRLVKHWNALDKKVYDSFLLEQWIVNQSFWGCFNQKDYFFAIFDKLDPLLETRIWRRDKIQRAKNIIRNVRDFEQKSMFIEAEIELLKLIP